jgi:hypothetical protein
MNQQHSASSNQPTSEQTLTPLSINHLLLLLLTVSVSLACMAPGLDQFLGKPVRSLSEREWRTIVYILLGQLAIGLSLFGLIEVVRNWARGKGRPQTPGAVIFLALGPIAIFELIYRPLPLFLLNRIPDSSFQWFIKASEAVAASVYLAGGIVCVTAALRFGERLWRIALIIIGLWLSTRALWHTFTAAGPFITAPPGVSYSRMIYPIWAVSCLPVAVMVVVAAASDWWRRVSRHWLHVAAIVTVLLYAVAEIVGKQTTIVRSLRWLWM